jgi:hypothetical protein
MAFSKSWALGLTSAIIDPANGLDAAGYILVWEAGDLLDDIIAPGERRGEDADFGDLEPSAGGENNGRCSVGDGSACFGDFISGTWAGLEVNGLCLTCSMTSCFGSSGTFSIAS